LENGDKIMVRNIAASQLSPVPYIHEMLLCLISDHRLFRKSLSQHNMFNPAVIGLVSRGQESNIVVGLLTLLFIIREASI
jgi:hypothetical protein